MPLTQDPTLVTSTARSQPLLAAEPITRGQPFYLDTATTNQARVATNNGTVEQADVRGVALCDIAAGQYLLGSTDGATVNLGVAVALGEDAYLGAAGGIILSSEFLGGENVTHIGTAQADGSILQKVVATGGTQ